MNSPGVATLMLLACCSCATAQPDERASVPRVGAAMPCKVDPGRYYVVASSQTARGCSAVFAGSEFLLATIDERTVSFISTRAPSFRTPEGVSVGQTLAQVQAAGGGDLVDERGWGYFSVLPSGWAALYPGIPGVKGSPPMAETRVIALFQRQ